MTKKIFTFLGFLIFGSLAQTSYAIDQGLTREDSSLAKYTFTGLATSTSVILVDLSDVTNFPHSRTGYVNATNIRTVIDKVAGSTMTVKIGVVTAVSSTLGTVEWFYSNEANLDTVGTHLVDTVNYGPAQVRTYVNSSGVTPYMVTTDTTTNSTVYQTDVGLPTANAPAPGGSVFPAVGDIILSVVYETGAAASNITAEILYYTKP